MILVDTSVWADHFRKPVERLMTLNENPRLLSHPFVIGELAAGNLSPWPDTVAALRLLPAAPLVSNDDVYGLIERQSLMGSGLSFVDIHLLASAIEAGASLWTSDKRLDRAAQQLGCSDD
jgi:hypothetical protein